MGEDFIHVCPDCGRHQSAMNAGCWLGGRILGPEHLVEVQPREVEKVVIEKKPAALEAKGDDATTGIIVLAWILLGIGSLASISDLFPCYVFFTLPIIVVMLSRSARRSADPYEGSSQKNSRSETSGCLILLQGIGLLLLAIVGFFVACVAVCSIHPPHFGH